MILKKGMDFKDGQVFVILKKGMDFKDGQVFFLLDDFMLGFDPSTVIYK